MPQLPLTDRQFLKKQYRDASNLNKRVQLVAILTASSKTARANLNRASQAK